MSKPLQIQVAQVIVEVPARNIDQSFDYLIPASLQSLVQIGSRVIVPFGKRKTQGYVIGLKPEEAVDFELKEIEQVLDPIPPLTEELIQLGAWMSREYICLQITALQAMLPSVLKSKTEKYVKMSHTGERVVDYRVVDRVTTRKLNYVRPKKGNEELKKELAQLPANARKQREIIHFFTQQENPLPLQELLKLCQTSSSVVQALVKKGILEVYEQEVRRDPYEEQTFEQTSPLPLTPEQNAALHQITLALDKREHQTFLLHGVTGSGKTEVYLQAIAHALKQGKEAILLVPEISLTPQMVERFKGRFGQQVAVLHSGLSSGERYDEWRKILEGKAKVAIGARSALFAPFKKLGLIIIDEEHESTYKQEENPRYHARDIAIFRGKYHHAPVILGSATPSLESYARAQKGIFTLLTLKERVNKRPLPSVTIVDMRQELHKGNRTMFSQVLYEKIGERLARKEQIVLFLNRRGFSTFVMCRDCGYVVNCPHCDISLTYHKVNETHRCHYCGYAEGAISHCPACQSKQIRFFGTGTQRVEEELYKYFPGIKVIRMDVDTTNKKGAHQRFIQAFKNREADCLLGTQMIAKGLDFEHVTLVGVISADSLLYIPDFRAAEKTFQLLTQVSGRAGRHQLPGEVVIQTYTPEHYSIQLAAKHDYSGFYREEMKARFLRGYLPFYYLALVTFSHEDLPYLVKIAQHSADWLRKQLDNTTQVLGPVPSSIPRVKDRYRYQCMIKYKTEPKLTEILNQLLIKLEAEINRHKLTVQIDLRP